MSNHHQQQQQKNWLWTPRAMKCSKSTLLSNTTPFVRKRTDTTSSGKGFCESWNKPKMSILIQELTKNKELYLWSGGGDHHIGHEVIPFIHALPKTQEVSAQPAMVRQHDENRIPAKQIYSCK